MRGKALLAAFVALMVVSAVPGTVAAAGPPINYDAEQASPAYIHEDTLTIAEHDRGEMDSLLEYYDDNGDVASLPAHRNTSQDEPVGVRFDKVQADKYQVFPRVSGESDNAETWLNNSNWSAAGGASSKMTISDADGNPASGVEAVSFDASSMSAGDHASANFSRKVDISSDVSKRVAFMVFNVNTLASGANVSVNLTDSDGDHYNVYIDPDKSADLPDVAANSTGDGYVFQEKLNNLNSTGTVDSIQYVNVTVMDDDAKVTLVGFDLESKTMVDLGETMHDGDGDGDQDESVTRQVINGTDADSPGTFNMTGLDTMGSWADDATIHDLDVYRVHYSEEDLEDAEDWDVQFSEAPNYGSYPQKLNKTVRLQVPTAIDLSHGNLELKMHQGLVEERYQTVEYATDTGSTDLHNVSDSSYTSAADSFTDKGGEISLTTGISAGNNVIVHSVITLLDSDADALQSTGGAAGPVGQDGGGGFLRAIGDFIMSPLGAIASFVSALLGARKLGWIGG